MDEAIRTYLRHFSISFTYLTQKASFIYTLCEASRCLRLQFFYSGLMFCRLQRCSHTLFSILGESPRWLLAKGRVKEAMKEIKRAAAMNKRQLPANLLNSEMKTLSKVSYIRYQ